jgi:hypothetical protein
MRGAYVQVLDLWFYPQQTFFVLSVSCRITTLRAIDMPKETAVISLNSCQAFAHLKMQPNKTRIPAKDKLRFPIQIKALKPRSSPRPGLAVALQILERD